MFKNAAASAYTEKVVRKACAIPNDCELASLFTLIDRIKRNETMTNARQSVVYRTVMERLKTYWVRFLFFFINRQFSIRVRSRQTNIASHIYSSHGNI
jgi:hypothetical protein